MKKFLVLIPLPRLSTSFCDQKKWGFQKKNNGLMAESTNQPPVQDYDPNTPLGLGKGMTCLFTVLEVAYFTERPQKIATD
jgi:hypothetical protein